MAEAAPALTEIELELTFLAREVPAEIKGVEPVVMEDTYFPQDPSAHAQLRVRRKANDLVIMKKLPVVEGDASAHTEYSIPLNADEYAALSAASTRKISKHRYKVVIGGYPAEVDIFSGALSGLILIDFEFSDMEAKELFEAPSCCGADVTNEEFLAGGVLSSLTYEDISADLDGLGYTKLQV